MEKKDKDVFFVEVHDSPEVRRNLLESLKEIVENMQRFEKFKETRRDKIEHINKLSKIIKEINKLMPRLKNSLPEVKLRASKSDKPEQPKHIIKKKAEPSKEHIAVEKEKPISELQKLESELSEIESKLSGLK